VIANARIFQKWADANPNDPLTLQVSSEIEQLNRDLRLTQATRLERMATELADAVRLMPPPAQADQAKAVRTSPTEANFWQRIKTLL
jgi:hypothetical protein